MKTAARLIPSLSQPLRSARPTCLAILSRPSPAVTTAAGVAGPSSAARLYATTSNISPTSIPSTSATAAEEEIPSNVQFEEMSEEADEDVDWALAQQDADIAAHFPALAESGRFNPILLPISSLSSTTPTLPADSDLVVSLPPEVFAQPIRRDILHRCVVWYLSTLRSGTKSTKSRSTVNYSGRKLQPQKGLGKARVGDASSGTRRGGAPIFPINPKDWSQALPRKVRELGMRIALSSKLSSGLLRVVQDFNEPQWQGTNEARRALCDSLLYPEVEESHVDMEPVLPSESITGEENIPTTSQEQEVGVQPEIIRRFGTPEDLSLLFLYSPNKLPEEITAFKRVLRNIPGIEIMSTDEVQVYHVLKYKWLILEGDAVDALSGVEMWDVEEEVYPLSEEVGEDVGSRLPA